MLEKNSQLDDLKGSKIVLEGDKMRVAGFWIQDTGYWMIGVRRTYGKRSLTTETQRAQSILFLLNREMIHKKIYISSVLSVSPW